MTRIPVPFAPITELHDRILERETAIHKKLYTWLARMAPRGSILQVDEEDFKSYCDYIGMKVYCGKYFRKAMNRLSELRIVKIIRRFWGGGYEVATYEPWQLDGWEPEDKKNYKKTREKIFCNGKLTFRHGNKISQKLPSNTDSSVPSYIDKLDSKKDKYKKTEEKTAISNGSNKIDVTNERQKIAAQKKESEIKRSIKPPVLKSSARQEKFALDVTPPKSGLSVDKSNFKQHSDDVRQIDPRDTFSRKADVELFDNFLDRADDLGIRVNATVKKYVAKYIKRGDSRRIETALELFKSRKRTGAIAEPEAYFIQILKEDYGKEKKIAADPVNSFENLQAKFNHWLELAKMVGCCSGYEIVDEQIIVNMNGSKETWEEAFNRGYNFEYLKNRFRSQ